MLYCIIGKSCTGKDTLATALRDYFGKKMLCSYTTRKRRVGEGDTHIFISSEEANQFTDRVAETTINGNEYFATYEQVKQSDVYIIDYKGLKELEKNLKGRGETIVVVYMRAKDERMLPEMYMRREKGEGVFPQRGVAGSKSSGEDALKQVEELRSKLKSETKEWLSNHGLTKEDMITGAKEGWLTKDDAKTVEEMCNRLKDDEKGMKRVEELAERVLQEERSENSANMLIARETRDRVFEGEFDEEVVKGFIVVENDYNGVTLGKRGVEGILRFGERIDKGVEDAGVDFEERLNEVLEEKYGWKLISVRY